MLAAALAATGAITGMLPASPAHATNGQKEVIALVGSDTTTDVMTRLAKKYRNNANGVNPDLDNTQNVPPQLNPGTTFTIPGQVPPASPTVPAFTYGGAGTGFPAPPNGSTNGKIALCNDGQAGGTTTGTIDIARSSSESAQCGLERWAFALDAVSWAAYRTASCDEDGGGSTHVDDGPAGCAPKNLAQQEVIDIYDCDAGGSPLIGNWSQTDVATVADNAPIVRYVAQPGSGTRAFFDSGVLNGLNSQDPQCTLPAIEVQESFGTAIPGSATNVASMSIPRRPLNSANIAHSEASVTGGCANDLTGDGQDDDSDGFVDDGCRLDPAGETCLDGLDNNGNGFKDEGCLAQAILPYSFANWTSQKNTANTNVPDVRGGTKLGKINGVLADSTTIQNQDSGNCSGGNQCFLGTRRVYNMTKATSPNHDEILAFVGVHASNGPGYVCKTGGAQNIVTLFGFIPLPNGPTAASGPLSGVNSHCRFS